MKVVKEETTVKIIIEMDSEDFKDFASVLGGTLEDGDNDDDISDSTFKRGHILFRYFQNHVRYLAGICNKKLKPVKPRENSNG